MELKNLKITALMTVALAATAFTAAAKEYPIPATQEEFDSQWTVVLGEVDGTWTWVDDTTPYAKIPAVNDGEKSATLVLNEPIAMKAGDTYYLQAKVSSDHYNNDLYFYIVYGTDKDNLQALPTTSYDFKCWGKSGGGVNWTTKPADTSNARTLKITEDGDYYIGIRCWKSNKVGVGELCVASILAEKSVDYPARVTGGKAVSLEGKLGAKLTWTWPTKTKDGNAIDEELTANIYRATSDSKAELYLEKNIVGKVTGGVAGQAGEFTDDPDTSLNPITEPGKYYYYVAPANALGENSECASSAVITCKWVGEETKFQPILNSSYYPVKASMIDESSVEITFTPRKDAVNGGWYDESQVLLKVTRQLGSADPVVVTESAPMVSPFVDNTLTEPGIYTYYLYVVYKGNESSATKVNPLFAGGTLPLPFSEDFSATDAFNNFSVLSTSTSYKWTRSYNGCAQLNSYSSGNYSTLVTAPIKVEAGKTYHISCVSWSGNTNTVKEISIVEGSKAADQNDLTAIATFEVDTEKKTYEAYYSPAESGLHYFGFKSDATSNYIYLDDILVEETTPSPAKVTDLTAVPDAAGALSAHVTFTIPSTTNAGQPLTELTAVHVARVAGENVEVIKAITGEECLPGASVEFDDEVPEAGMYAYEVISHLGENVSDKAVTEAAWVGYDIPKQISSFGIRAELNTKGGADIKWPALSGTVLGINGGYVDVENLRYRIYRVAQLFGEEPVIVGETGELTFVDNELADAAWNKYKYCISVLNGTQESKLSEGNAVTGGIVDGSDYNPDFTDTKWIEALEGRAFYPMNDALAFADRGATAGQEYTVYFPTFVSNKVSGKNYMLTLNLSRGDADFEELLEVYLCTVELTSPTPESGNTPDTEAAVIAGADNRKLIETIPVQATAEAPAKEEVSFSTPAEGRFRLALRCASEDNKLLNIHGLSLVTDPTVGVDAVDMDNACVMVGMNGELIIPADAKAFMVYRPDGSLVAQGNGGDEFTLTAGMYIVRVVKADDTPVTIKVIR